MQTFVIIVVLLFMILASVIAAQNAGQDVTLQFLLKDWSVTINALPLILVSMLLGVILTAVLGISSWIKQEGRVRRLNSRIRELEKELAEAVSSSRRVIGGELPASDSHQPIAPPIPEEDRRIEEVK
jgi:uncharacterized membrane protein YciS (DUF1049 family)